MLRNWYIRQKNNWRWKIKNIRTLPARSSNSNSSSIPSAPVSTSRSGATLANSYIQRSKTNTCIEIWDIISGVHIDFFSKSEQSASKINDLLFARLNNSIIHVWLIIIQKQGSFLSLKEQPCYFVAWLYIKNKQHLYLTTETCSSLNMK